MDGKEIPVVWQQLINILRSMDIILLQHKHRCRIIYNDFGFYGCELTRTNKFFAKSSYRTCENP